MGIGVAKQAVGWYAFEMIMGYYNKRIGGKVRLVIIVVLVGLAVIGGWLLWGRSGEIRNVILVSLDTCRADHLSCYGFERKTTPNIDAIAAEGILYTQAISPIALTLPAHSSVFTGTYPPYHRVHDNLDDRLGDSSVTLAEVLSKAGYTTGAIVSTFVLDSQFGMYQGFDSYDDEFEVPIGPSESFERRGDETTRHALAYLEEHQKEQFFLFLHYYDPHTPYIPLEPFASEYADDLYAGEVAFTDQCVGQVVAKLKELGLYGNTLLVIMGDHGEGLGEHGEAEHGYYVYQYAVHVPLIVRPPGLGKEQRVDEVVSLVDIMPTILGYLGIEPPEEVQGRDLREYGQEEQRGEERYVYCEAMTGTKYGCNPLLGLVGTRWKYIETKRPELYDLAGDPGEGMNLLEADSEMSLFMRGELAGMVSRLIGGQLTDEKITLDDEDIKRLESLGYVGGESMVASFEVDESKADPKERIGYHEARVKVTYLLCQGKYDEAREICYEMLETFPEVPNTYAILGKIAFELREYAESIEYNSKFLAVMEAEASGEKTAASSTGKRALMATKFLALAHFDLAQYEEAEKYFRQMLAARAGDVETESLLAMTLYKLGRLDEALELWRALLRVRPQSVAIHRSMGGAYHKQGNLTKALEHWDQVVRLAPKDYSVKNNLAWILATVKDEKLRDAEAAVQLAEEASELTEYKVSGVLDTLGVAYAAAGRFGEAVEATEKAIALAREAGEDKDIGAIEDRLALYRAGECYEE